MRAELRLISGWVVSITDRDTPPAKANVIAWRASQENMSLERRELFEFPDGARERRCFSVIDIIAALEVIGVHGGPER